MERIVGGGDTVGVQLNRTPLLQSGATSRTLAVGGTPASETVNPIGGTPTESVGSSPYPSVSLKRKSYTLLLQREEHVAPSSSSSLVSIRPIIDESFSGMFRSPPRPLAFDDPRFTRIATTQEKPLAHSDEESESLRRVRNDGKIESTSLAAKLCGYSSGVSTKCCSDSSLKHSSTEITSGITYMFPSSEEEDVCPTCLEEYTSDNPRIILQCSHHFHLGCIYEWMERSELCPVCGKMMIFNESS